MTCRCLRVAAPDGKLRAVVFGYACHNTTLGGDGYQINGDYAGFAQIEAGKGVARATAMFLQLCGGRRRTRIRAARWSWRRSTAKRWPTRSSGCWPARCSRCIPRFALPTRTSAWISPAKTGPCSRGRPRATTSFRKRRAEAMLAAIDAGRPIWQVPVPVQVVGLGDKLVDGRPGRRGGGRLFAAAEARISADRLDRRRLYERRDVLYPVAPVLREGGYEADNSMVYYCQAGTVCRGRGRNPDRGLPPASGQGWRPASLIGDGRVAHCGKQNENCGNGLCVAPRLAYAAAKTGTEMLSAQRRLNMRAVNRRRFVAPLRRPGWAWPWAAERPWPPTSRPCLGGKRTRSQPFPSWPVTGRTKRRSCWPPPQRQVVPRRRRNVDKFEAAYARLTGAKHCIATNGGTTALVRRAGRPGHRAGRRGHRHALHLHRQHHGDHDALCPAGLRRHRSGDVPDRSGQDRGGHHRPHGGDHARPHRRQRGQSGRHPRRGQETQACR